MKQKKDRHSKILLDYADVFADIMNVLVCKNGNMKADELTPGPTESSYKAANGDFAGQYRDITKYWEKGNTKLSLLALENQSTIDRRMTLRVISYDGSSYRSQYDNKKIYPVMTAVLNFSDQVWSEKYKSLHQMFEVPKILKDCIQDYKILVIDVAFLEEDIRNRFKSDFKAVAEFFYRKRLGLDISDSEIEIEHVEAFIDFLTVFTKDNRYSDAKKSVITRRKKGERIKMCTVAQGLIDRGYNQGQIQGQIQGREEIIYELVKEKSISLDTAAQKLEISVEEFLLTMESKSCLTQSV